MAMSLSEIRVLGALIEKEFTTPDVYPLSYQALVAACNQKTSRDPVMSLHLQEVREALQRLVDRGLAAVKQEAGDRVPKARHLLRRAFSLDNPSYAVLAVLLLRGAQTPGELRQRTERYGVVHSAQAIDDALAQLAAHTPPLAKNLGRGPGQAQDRYMHTLGGETEPVETEPRTRVRTRQAAVQPDSEALTGTFAAGQMQLISQMLLASVAELSNDEALLEPPHGNSANWLVAHLTSTNAYAISLLGGTAPELPSELRTDPAAIPIEALKQHWRSTVRAFCDAAEHVPASRWDEAATFAGRETTVAGVISMLLFHAGYHVGHFTPIRNMLELPRIMG